MATSAKIAPVPSNAAANWQSRARYFNSGNAFALQLPEVPSVQFSAERDRAFDADAPSGLIDMDLSDVLGTPFPATTPLVLSRYLRVRPGEQQLIEVRASAQLYCVLAGRGSSEIDGEQVSWKCGDVLALPGNARVCHRADADSDQAAVLWFVSDEPALAFLDLQATDATDSPLQPVHYLAEDLDAELEAVYRHPDADKFAGFAVVLSQQGLEQTRNIHQTMTLALNSLPPGQAQRPHRHNSMALTLCLNGDQCYSLIDGERKDWQQHAVMLTPPGAVHSHHNDSGERMRCLIVQDGGLHYHARTMGFAFAD